MAVDFNRPPILSVEREGEEGVKKQGHLWVEDDDRS